MNQHPINDVNIGAATAATGAPGKPPSCVYAASLLHRFRRGERVDAPTPPHRHTLGSTDAVHELAWKEFSAALDRSLRRAAFPSG